MVLAVLGYEAATRVKGDVRVVLVAAVGGTVSVGGSAARLHTAHVGDDVQPVPTRHAAQPALELRVAESPRLYARVPLCALRIGNLFQERAHYGSGDQYSRSQAVLREDDDVGILRTATRNLLLSTCGEKAKHSRHFCL